MNKKQFRQNKIAEIIKMCIQKKCNLNQTFEEISKELKIKKESAKNYYYNFASYLKQNPEQHKELSLKKLVGGYFNKFTENEIEDLVAYIDNNLLKGISVRQSCLTLAGNDAKTMLRLQNKYRNIKVKERKKKMEEKGKIINFDFARNRLNKKITDDDINALFSGLVKIVKRSAIDSVEQELKTECNEANENFRATLIDLNKKEAELKVLQEENRELNLKLEAQKEQICKLLQKLSNRKIKNLEKKSENKTLKLKKFYIDNK